MSGSHLVRVGVMGNIGRFRAVDALCYARGARVVLRTARGLELGEVLAGDEAAGEPDGSILRPMTPEDELLVRRINKHKARGLDACAEKLAELGVGATLIDVEHLFDGRSLYFYFLGKVTPEIEKLTGVLAEIYEEKVQFRKFAETLVNGCGPNCGTEEAEGGCTSCTACAVSVACGSRK